MCEAFTTLLLLNNCIEVVNMSPSKIKNNIFFPKALQVLRIPSDLFPEEVAPPLSWQNRNTNLVCLVNTSFNEFIKFQYHTDEGIFAASNFKLNA